MAFKNVPISEVPVESMKEHVCILRTPALTESLKQEMCELLLGETNPPEHFDFAEALVAAGCFSSKGQANKAGAKDTEVPDGLSVFVIGKLKTAVWIWKPAQ